MTAIDSLASTLKVPTERLAPLATYDDVYVSALDALLSTAMTREDAEFEEGLNGALRFVPALLRPAAKKLLFGGGRRG